MAPPTLSAYELVLDRLREASRALSEHIDTADAGGLRSPQFVEVWADYQRVLAESQEAFRRIPKRFRLGATKPPSE